MKYKNIRDSIDLEIWELDGHLEDVISELVRYKKICDESGYINPVIDISLYEEYHCPAADVSIVFTRKETDKERDKRLLDAKKQREKNKSDKIKREEKDAKEYERLKAKFEK